MVTIIAALVALVLGGIVGYVIFRYVIKGKYGICVEVCPTKSLFMLSTHRSPVPAKFVVYHKGTARVAKPRLASVPKVAPSEVHSETPPPKVVAAVETPAEAPIEEPKPTPKATPPATPGGKKKK